MESRPDATQFLDADPADWSLHPLHGARALCGGSNKAESTILVVGALTFFPALVLGSIAEYFAMKSGLTF
jgi:hypothetical protein